LNDGEKGDFVAATVNADAAHPSILVVDDAPFFRKTLRDLLEGQGYPVLEAASGAEVSDIITRYPVGAVLTDIEMPEVSGPEVLRRVKRLRPELPVIVISSHHDFDAAREVLRDGALEYLVKPLDPTELFKAVERAGQSLAASLQTAEALLDAQRRFSDLVLLQEVGEATGTEENQQLLLDKILELVRDAMQVEIISLMLVEKDGLMRIRSASGLTPEIVERTRVAPGQGVSGHVLATGNEILLEDIVRDGRFPCREGDVAYRTRSALSMPIRMRDRVIGVLNVNNKVNGDSLSAADRNLLRVIAHQTALAIENFKLVANLRQQALDLVKSNRTLQRLHQARSQLVCNLSTELKGPLLTLRGAVDVLSNCRGELSVEETGTYLGKINGEAQRLERLLSGMLCLFSLDSGGGELEQSSFSLNEVIEEAAQARADDIALASLQVVLRQVRGVAPVYGDRDKTLTLVEALLDNAIKFNRQGGGIRLRLENAITDGLGYVYFQISNDGQPIPESMVENIFEQHLQLGNSPGDKSIGAGIGLAVCRAVVERMKGKIFLEPPQGEGATFGVLLPTRESYGVIKNVQ